MQLENRVFSTADSKQISDKYVAVRLLGGNDLDDEGRDFMQRYGVQGYPTLLAMTPDGAVLGTDFQRDVAGILATMDQAATADQNFRTKAKELGASKLPEAVRTMAGLYKDRMQWAEARTRYEQLVAAGGSVEDKMSLLDVLGKVNDVPARKELLAKLVSTCSDRPECIQWRIDLATADLPTVIRSRDEYVAMLEKKKTALEGLLSEVKSAGDQAVVRNELANALSGTGDKDGAAAHWDWILANAKDCPAVPDALWGKAIAAVNGGYMDSDVAMVKEGRALLQKIVDEHGSHQIAGQARRALMQVEQLITQLEAKAGGDEDGGDDDDGDEEDK